MCDYSCFGQFTSNAFFHTVASRTLTSQWHPKDKWILFFPFLILTSFPWTFPSVLCLPFWCPKHVKNCFFPHLWQYVIMQNHINTELFCWGFVWLGFVGLCLFICFKFCGVFLVLVSFVVLVLVFWFVLGFFIQYQLAFIVVKSFWKKGLI